MHSVAFHVKYVPEKCVHIASSPTYVFPVEPISQNHSRLSRLFCMRNTILPVMCAVGVDSGNDNDGDDFSKSFEHTYIVEIEMMTGKHLADIYNWREGGGVGAV